MIIHQLTTMMAGAHRGPLRPRAVVLIAAALYAVSFFVLCLCLQAALKTQMNDLGNADQALWAAANGDLAMTQSNTLAGVDLPRFMVHANLIFFALVPLYWITPSTVWLALVASLSCAAAGLGLYAFARRRLGDTGWALVAPLAFFASPLTHDANLYDFHVITLYTALLVWAIYAFDAGRPRLAWPLFALALLCKEDVPLIGIMVGGFLAATGKRREGIIAALVSIGYFGLLQAGRAAMPEATPEMAFRWHWLGRGPIEMITTLFTSPGEVVMHLLRPDKIRLPVYLLVGGGLAALRGWPALLLLVPTVAMAMLSSQGWSTRLTGTYYFVFCGAAIIMACVMAAEGLRRKDPSRRPWQLIYLATATAVLSVVFSPLPHGLFASWSDFSPAPSRHALAEIAAQIPAEARLCVQNNLGPHVAQRRDVHSLGRCRPDVEYVLVSTHYTLGPNRGFFVQTSPAFLYESESRERAMGWLRESPAWRLQQGLDGTYLFARRPGRESPSLDAGSSFELERELVRFAEQGREAESHRVWWSPILSGSWGE